MTLEQEVSGIVNRLNDTSYYNFKVIRFNSTNVLILDINFKNWYYDVSYKDNELYVEFSNLNEVDNSVTRSMIADWENIIETILNRERLSI